MRLLVIRSADELSVKGAATIIIKVGGRVRERAIRDVDAVLIIGSRVSIRSSLPPVLSQHNIPLAIIAKDSVSILTNPVLTKYSNYRRLQYQLSKTEALSIALEYIKAKIRGMQNILKYHRRGHPPTTPPPNRSGDAARYEEEIRIWESTTSHLMWAKLTEMIKPEHLKTLKEQYGFTGRKPRHPDPFNKALSVMYAVLYTLATKALIAAGLDPTHGFLHRTKYSTPLTFDYTEMFKPIAIEATITLINNEGLPQLDQDRELTREWVNNTIKQLYKYLVLKHKDKKRHPTNKYT